MTGCLHDVPMDEDCKDCHGTQGRLAKLVCHKCESKDELIASYREALEFLETVATGENQVDVFDNTEALHWIATYIREKVLTEPTKPGEQESRD